MYLLWQLKLNTLRKGISLSEQNRTSRVDDFQDRKKNLKPDLSDGGDLMREILPEQSKTIPSILSTGVEEDL